VEHSDERRLTFAQAVDRALPYTVVGGIALNLAVLGWLCLGQITLQSQVTLLIDRSTNTARTQDRLISDSEAAKANDAYMQREIDDLKARR
jgi:hypothetical protein